jgi:hypothetical protein
VFIVAVVINALGVSSHDIGDGVRERSSVRDIVPSRVGDSLFDQLEQAPEVSSRRLKSQAARRSAQEMSLTELRLAGTRGL